jgi:hypothetical protein
MADPTHRGSCPLDLVRYPLYSGASVEPISACPCTRYSNHNEIGTTYSAHCASELAQCRILAAMHNKEHGPTRVEGERASLSPSRGFERFLDALEGAHQLTESHNGLLTELTLDGQRLILQELEHAVLLRAATYAFSSGQPSPTVEMLFYLDNHLTCYPIALRGAAVGRLTNVQAQRQLALFADRWAVGLNEQGWVRCGRSCTRPQQGALLAPELALSQVEKTRLAGWLAAAGCEATDDCPVGPYTRCPHGCPSWFVELNLI